jgi:BirA family transcriptional regulator, biotin operon repressor / biotin---[acetyl-CoA-carboxylase] ligase
MRAENFTVDAGPRPGRKPLDAAAVRAAVIRPGDPGCLWHAIQMTPRTGSTNADLLALARDGAAEGTVLVAEEQTAGRGRMGRTWMSPPHAALTFSLLLRPHAVPPARRGWLPLLAGVAVTDAVRAAAALDVRLKWPNDVLAGPAKLAVSLAGAAGDAVVVGIGINVSTEPEELPPPGPTGLAATSLREQGWASLDRELLLAEILVAFERWYLAWRSDQERCGLRAEYTRRCATIGRSVRVELPGGQLLSGEAVGVDRDGRLLVRPSPGSGAAAAAGSGAAAVAGSGAAAVAGSEVAVAAGDVVHLR